MERLYHTRLYDPAKFPWQTTSQHIDNTNLEAVLIQLQKDVTECESYLAQQQKILNIKALEQQMTENIEKMAAIGDRINALATQLEVEILCLRKIALHTNQHILSMRRMQLDEFTLCHSPQINILEINCFAIPTLINHDSKFILKSKYIDFLQAERQQGNLVNQVTRAAQQKREALEQWLVIQRNKL